MVQLNHGSKGQSGASMHPQTNYGDSYSGQDPTVQNAALLACLASQDQTTIARHLIQVGIDSYEVHLQNGAGFWNLGGLQTTDVKFPILFAGHLLDNAGMKAPRSDLSEVSKPNLFKFAEDGFSFMGDAIATENPYEGGGGADWQASAPWWGDDCAEIGQSAEPFNNHNCRAQSPANQACGVSPGTHAATDADRYPGDADSFCATPGQYRTCCQCGNMGYGLAARLIDSAAIKTLWSHAPFFEYLDRIYAEGEADAEGTGPASMYGSLLCKQMWDTYR
jgi:hypothetical protein